MTKEYFLSEMLETKEFRAFYRALKGYMLVRLDLPEYVKEDQIRGLVKFSAQMKLPGADPVFIEEKLAGTDCHQTSYIVSKKTLLMMEVERKLGVHPAPEVLDGVDTVRDYAALLFSLRAGGNVCL